MYAFNNEFFQSETTDQEHDHTSCSSFFLVPSPIYIPLEDETVFCEFFQQQAFFSDNPSYNIVADETNYNLESAMGEFTNEDGQEASVLVRDDELQVEPKNDTPKKTLSCSERHSKINTARGLRGRRMRLSLDVAKKLFWLQDLLGFDKASTTIDWLLTESKSAILDLLPDRSCSLMGVSSSALSSTSECEVASGTVDQKTTNNKAKCSSGRSKKQKEKIGRVRKCADFHHPLAKETRVRARQRARERTIEKWNNCNVSEHYVKQLGSWSTFQENQVKSMNELNQMSSNFQFKQVGAADNAPLLMTGNCSSSYFGITGIDLD